MADAAEIEVTYDEFMDAHQAWTTGERDAASDGGKRRAEMKEFQERTNVQKKALSHIRAGLKIQKEGEQKDWFRSMRVMLDLIEPAIMGQGTSEMDLGDEPADEAKAIQEEADQFEIEADKVDDEAVVPFNGAS